MLEYALEQMDSGATSVWRMLSHSLKDMMVDCEYLKNEIKDVWDNADYIPNMNNTFEAIKEALNLDWYGDWSQEGPIQSLKSLCSFGTDCTTFLVLFLLLGVVIWRSVSACRTTLTSDGDKTLNRTSSPAKVLSIFEMAKTAYIKGHTEEVVKLVDRLRFDVNFPIPTTGMSVLLCACISGEKRLVRFLLQRDGDARSVNCDGDSCLYLATFATRNDADDSLVEMLIKHGCNVNGQNFRGNTALHLAASRGNIRLAQTLLSYGADSQRANNAGVSPLDCAINAGHMETADMLKKVLSM